MEVPWHKKLMSYVTEYEVEHSSSEFNPSLTVSYRNERYVLNTDNAVYSYEDLYHNFSYAFQKIDLESRAIEKVLILGLGLGSIPIILEKTFKKENYHYTAVEIDEEVIRLASLYGLPKIKSPIEIICADAYAYLLQSNEKFDLITVDVFLDNKIPESFESDLFTKSLRNCLNDNGVLLYNRLSGNTKEFQKTEQYFLNNFSTVFPKASKLRIKGNSILCNEPFK